MRGFGGGGGGGGGAAAKARARESILSSQASWPSENFLNPGRSARKYHSFVFRIMPDWRISAIAPTTISTDTAGLTITSAQVMPASRNSLSANRAALSASPSWAEPTIPSSFISRSVRIDVSDIARASMSGGRLPALRLDGPYLGLESLNPSLLGKDQRFQLLPFIL